MKSKKYEVCDGFLDKIYKQLSVFKWLRFPKFNDWDWGGSLYDVRAYEARIPWFLDPIARL
jgi:hypothetical protein